MPAGRKKGKRERSVFLNIPYDKQFARLYLAYIAGLTTFGIFPRATLEIPTSQRRIERILALIKECTYSIHDLSRVQLDRSKPRVPRFNMPFELGLAVAVEKRRRNPRWYVFEAQRYRVNKTLSDLGGTDVHVHYGTVQGVFGVLLNVFVREREKPTVQQMQRVYRALRRLLPAVLKAAGTKDIYSARVYRDLVVTARRVLSLH